MSFPGIFKTLGLRSSFRHISLFRFVKFRRGISSGKHWCMYLQTSLLEHEENEPQHMPHYLLLPLGTYFLIMLKTRLLLRHGRQISGKMVPGGGLNTFRTWIFMLSAYKWPRFLRIWVAGEDVPSDWQNWTRVLIIVRSCTTPFFKLCDTEYYMFRGWHFNCLTLSCN